MGRLSSRGPWRHIARPTGRKTWCGLPFIPARNLDTRLKDCPQCARGAKRSQGKGE